MHRRALRLSLLVACNLGVLTAGCAGDATEADGGGADSSASSGGATDSMGTLTAASADSSGGMSASQGSMSAGSDSSATDSAGTDSAGTDSAGTDSAGTDSAGTDSAGTDSAGTDSAGTDSDSDTGIGPGDPPTEPPGVDVGLCNPPGEQQWCYSGAPPTYNIGICHPGIQECQQIDLDVGQWGPCGDEQTPEMEVCDGLDNDCDGEVDEDQGTSHCGLGICAHDEATCVDGEPNECDPNEGAGMEVCNGLDDDCDGMIDDGLGDQEVECGLGQCEHTVSACDDGGNPPACDPLEGASMEVCDGIDNDCDGDTDEDLGDLSCGVGQCAHTLPACINGIPQTCDPYDGATTEECDGIDNDCDGLTDEDQGNWVCGSFDCQVSVPTCIDGVPQPPESCVPLPGGDEICGDGIDNNCDGESPDCVETFLVGTDNQIRPVDIVWAIDTSGSMSEEIQTVEDNINSFASTLAASGSSTRLHLIADRGTGTFNICVAPPLGGNACADNAPQFYQYDTNGTGVSMAHSNNALGRIMQQSPTWIPRLQTGSHIAFIVTTDDNGDDTSFTETALNLSAVGGQHAECSNGFIADNTTGDPCRWDDPNSNNFYTSLAEDSTNYGFNGYFGFEGFMANFFPAHVPDADWSFYPIIGGTGTNVLTGGDDAYEFSCATRAANGIEYVRLALFTSRQDSMTAICANDWDLDGLASDIVSSIPNDTYVLTGNPAGQCLNINPATIEVLVNAIPMPATDWSYDAPSCTLTITNNVPVVGDNVVIVYDNF